MGGYLFQIGLDRIIRRCVREDEIYDILKASHDEPCGGHFADKRTTYKVLHSGYYWNTIFKDAKKFVYSCDGCQRMGKLVQRDEIPLQPEVLIKPFERWALDFVGPITLASKGKNYILICMDYVSKWIEAKALPRATKQAVANFLYEYIFSRFGVPREIVTDQRTQFTSNLIQSLM